MVPFKGELSVFARVSPVTTAGAVRSATLATAGLLVNESTDTKTRAT